jgi:hypothetical protein
LRSGNTLSICYIASNHLGFDRNDFRWHVRGILFGF